MWWIMQQTKPADCRVVKNNALTEVKNRTTEHTSPAAWQEARSRQQTHSVQLSEEHHFLKMLFN